MKKTITYLSLLLLSGASMLWGSDITGVSQSCIEEAKLVPKRLITGNERSWNCGPDTLARFFVLSDLDFAATLQSDQSYKLFTQYCPRSFGQPVSREGYVICGAFAAASLYSLGIGWDGYSDIACGIASGACALAPFIIEAYNKRYGLGKVGPTPNWLAGYGNQILSNNNSKALLKVKNFSNQYEASSFIDRELHKGRPVIVLVNYGPLAWHYINLISINNNNYEYLDEQNIYNNSKQEIMRQMDFDKEPTTKKIKTALKYCGSLGGVDIGRFNLIYLQSEKLD